MIPRLLLVGTGTGGGIGRYELLVVQTLEQLQAAEKVSFSALWRRQHPPYLRSGHHSERHLATEASSPTALAFEIYRAARRARPDIVLFTHVNLARLALVLPHSRFRPRVVIAAHGIEVWTRLGWSKRVALRAADRVVAVSRYTANRLIEQHEVDARRVLTLPLSLEASWLEHRAGESAAADSPAAPLTQLLTVSRLAVSERAKGVDWVIRALPLVAQAVPGVFYTIVGEGDDLPRLQALARERGVAARVDFKSGIEHDELLDEYRACDVFVLPSAKEGFGLVFLEAMVFEKPVVARAAKGAPEVVADGETGVLVRAEPELAPALAKLLLDPKRASRLGATGRGRVLNEFSPTTFRARMWALIMEMSAR